MGTSGSAGFYLFAAEERILKPRSSTAVFTHLQVEISTSYCGHILLRSGLACDNFIGVAGGVIDSNFWGEVNVIMFNHLNKLQEVRTGNRIAQVAFHHHGIPNFVKCEELSKTERGIGRIWFYRNLIDFLYCLDFLKNVSHQNHHL